LDGVTISNPAGKNGEMRGNGRRGIFKNRASNRRKIGGLGENTWTHFFGHKINRGGQKGLEGLFWSVMRSTNGFRRLKISLRGRI